MCAQDNARNWLRVWDENVQGSGSLGHNMQEVEKHSSQLHSHCCSVGSQEREGRVKKGR